MSRVTLECPSCGGQIIFQSMLTVFAVCSYCESMVVRRDLDLENLGKMAALPADMSPIQRGTSGVHASQDFTVIGRLKLQWDQGFWNEWYTMFSDGRGGWLAEAQGFFMMMFEEEQLPKLPDVKKISVGTKIDTSKGQFTIKDIKTATCVGAEGELPFKAPRGRQSVSADMEGPSEQFGTVDYGPEGVKVYLGRYVELEKMKLQNLREIDGW